jgi:iron complex outermembrane receptor protein
MSTHDDAFAGAPLAARNAWSKASRRQRRSYGVLAIVGLSISATAAEPEPARAEHKPLPKVLVTAEAVAADAPTPVAKSVVDAEALRRAGPRVDIAEVLPRVPGVVANVRWNYAQDTQLSIRGYGARASFGVRGVRLYVNGIPATAPDGQGQLSHAALGSAERVEVIRGPLAALYGNASGGVIKVDGNTRRGGEGLQAGALVGSELHREHAVYRLRGERGAGAIDASHLDYDGFRPHSAARRDSLDALGELTFGEWTLALTGNALDLPQAQDPLGLTVARFAADPYSTDPAAITFDTRKSVRQAQVGAALSRGADDGRPGMRLAAYGGNRDVEQYLSVPVAAQANPLSGGGVVDLGRDYGGVEWRGWKAFDTRAGALTLTLGVNLDRLDEARRGYENFAGGELGVRGALRRDERNRVDNTDLLVLAEWQARERWLLVGGVRANRVRFRSHDRYVTPNNPDDSGEREVDSNVPALGLVYRASAATTLHASVARATETPTVAELAFTEGGVAGFNRNLRAARSLRREVGLRWNRRRAGVDAALFRDDTDNDIVVAASSGGRTSFRNLDRSRRQGLELAAHLRPRGDVDARLAWTWLDARVVRDRRVCNGGGPCTIVPTDARLPAVPARFGFAELLWRPREHWQLGFEARYADRLFADDLNRVAAPSYTLLNISALRRFEIGNGVLDVYARLDNLADRVYVSSVIVNEGAGRSFEPGPGRTWLLGAEWRPGR